MKEDAFSQLCIEGMESAARGTVEFVPIVYGQTVDEICGEWRFNHDAELQNIILKVYYEIKDAYRKHFGITRSDCYEVWGMKRTGCACCPFGKEFEQELSLSEEYEPKLFKAAQVIFGKSYDYTRCFMEFRKNIIRPAHLSTLTDHPLLASSFEVLLSHVCSPPLREHPASSPKTAPKNEIRPLLGSCGLDFGEYDIPQPQ